MTWTTFAVTLLLAYLAYYGLNILFDVLISPRKKSNLDQQQELTFEEPSEAELISYTPEQFSTEVSLSAVMTPALSAVLPGKIHSTGGISIAEMLLRAKDDLLEFTKAIPY